MATATTVTIGIGSKTSHNYQSSEASVAVTYTLDQKEQADLLGFLKEKVTEVEEAHQGVRRYLDGHENPLLEASVANRRSITAAATNTTAQTEGKEAA